MATAALQPQQSSVWWVYLLQGIAAIFLGIMFITAPGATLVSLVTFLGFFFIINGVLSLVQMFADRSVPWIWSLLIGISGIVAGIFLVRHPLVAALTLPTVIVIVFGIEGLVMGSLWRACHSLSWRSAFEPESDRSAPIADKHGYGWSANRHKRASCSRVLI
jgi:uncharacterized membrane protein HdeD (DUF308 family)